MRSSPDARNDVVEVTGCIVEDCVYLGNELEVLVRVGAHKVRVPMLNDGGPAEARCRTGDHVSLIINAVRARFYPAASNGVSDAQPLIDSGAHEVELNPSTG